MATRVSPARVAQRLRPPPAAPTNRTATVLILLAADTLGWSAAVAAAVGIASVGGWAVTPEQLLLTTPALALTLIANAHGGLYRAAGVDSVEELRRLALRTSGVWWLVAAAMAVALGVHAIGLGVTAWAVALFALPLARSLARGVRRAFAPSAPPRAQRRRGQLALKRALDLALVVPAALLAAPLVLVAAAAVWLVSPGNPFFTQEREGLGGRTFRMWKLRTMYPDAAERLERHLAARPEAAAEWASRFKLADDPRVLPGIGRLLRVTSLDELPQVWNVLRGDMSMVGPRPFPDYHLATFDAEFRDLRRSVPPGLTGLWQVTARADADHDLVEELDTLYVTNWSFWMDVSLLARTPWAVVRGRGAY